MTPLPAGRGRRGMPAPLAIATALLLAAVATTSRAGADPSEPIDASSRNSLSSSSPSAPSAPDTPSITLQTVVPSGLSSPVALTHAGDGSGRIFITEQTGTIRILNGTNLAATPFLDIHTIVACCGEQGLLSVAFHPNYASNGFFYVYYTDKSSPVYNLVLARYQVSAGNSNFADPASGVILFSVPHPVNGNHNGGQLQFGPDGYLYMGTGDGGSGDDPPCNAQTNTVLLGKLLRVDVNQNMNQAPYYGIPPTNPFVGQGAPMDRIWDKGLRNPWRYSFDRTTGDLYIGDVGQNAYEEIDFEPAGSAGGVNYGWRVMEGFHCGNASNNTCPVGTPPCHDPSYTLPILEYTHSFGCSVTGGYVYRGSQFPGLHGYYLYSDFCSGIIWGAARDAAGVWSTTQLLDTSLSVSSFGQDETGKLYVLSLGGSVSRIDSSVNWPVPTVSAINPPSVIAGDPGYTLTVDGSGFAPGSTIQWNGANRTTTYVSLTRLTASISAADISTAGTASVSVMNPGPGGGASNAATVDINPTFLDVPLAYWARRQIQAVYDASVTTGCGPRKFCPDIVANRAQMAIFLLRGKDGPVYTPPAATGTVFTDVAAGSFAAAWIEEVAHRSVTAGCQASPKKFCPSDPVTRGQMAVFLLRTKLGPTYAPPTATGIFSDLPVSNPLAAWAEDLYGRGISAGCAAAPLRFCPGTSVTRAQMSVFITVAFGLPVPP